MSNLEIDEGIDYTGYREALDMVYANVKPVGIDEKTIEECVGYTLAEELIARVSSPTHDVSLKDGFAVRSEDVAPATKDNPVFLPIIGSVFAGSHFDGELKPGSAVKICSGSPIPAGADAVVSDEFCDETSSGVSVKADAESGRNILRAGEDIKHGSVIVKKGRVLMPGYLGLTAAAGLTTIKVFRRPRAAVVAIGDEVVAPGSHLHPGELYASNMVTMCAWLSSFDIPYNTSVVNDDKEEIKRELRKHLPDTDVILTSGGAWGSERDMVVGTLDELGWKQLFHHVRMGPGKGIAFGLWEGKPVFCLPGGPASNEMAFLQFTLPGILSMCGRNEHPLQSVRAKLTSGLKTRHKAWTEFKDATLSHDSDGNLLVTPYKQRSRLQAIATSTCLVCIPEGVESLEKGDTVDVQILSPTFGGLSGIC